MRIFLFLLVICCTPIRLFAQKANLDSLTHAYQGWRKTSLQEKVFMHTDRTSYLTGETMWFKAYRVESSQHRAIDWSKILYVELLDKNKIPVLQTKFLLDEHGCEGSIFLPASLYSGNYVLRAYTNWMKNAGPDFFFQQAIVVVNPFIALETSPDSARLSYDTQFFPEGGNLIYDLESIVGVRVANKIGNSVHVKGAILNEQKDTVARFNTSQFGLSKFNFVPRKGHSYTAIITDQNKRTFRYALPSPQPAGYVIHVKDSTEDKILIAVRSTGVDPEDLYLLGHTRQVLKVRLQAVINHGIAKFIIDKNSLDPGISIFTLFDKNLQPVCERLYFKKPEKRLSITVTGNPYLIQSRGKVKLDIALGTIADSINRPEMSVSIYKTDSLDQPVANIVNYLWLTSDLSGTIENPGYYFNEDSPELRNNTDILMLTHGWRKFNWQEIIKGKTNHLFLPEIGGHLISGKITEVATGKPAEGVPVYLSFMGTRVNVYVSESKKGHLLFETEPVSGNKSMIVQTNTNAGDRYRVEIEDPFFNKASVSIPPFVFNNKLSSALEQRSIHMQVQTLFTENKPLDKPAYGGGVFYGKPDETYLLDDYTRFPTLEEVMREYVPGIRVKKHKDEFHLSNIDLVNKTAFSSDPLVLVDGVPVFDINKLMEIDPLKLKQLDVIKRRYYLNAMAFDGIVSFTSYKGDLAGYLPPERALLMNYSGLEAKREFFTPRYDLGKKTETQPDTRHVLVWSAGNLPAHANHRIAEFFTSDIAGEYRIVIQALAPDGLPGYYTTTFLVK